MTNHENLDAGNSMDTHSTTENSQDVFDPGETLAMMRADPTLNNFVVGKFEHMKKLEEDRAAINDELKSDRSQMEAKGIPIDAIKIAYKLYKMDLDKVQTSVIGVALCMEAAGLPVQINFLDKAPVTNIY